MKPTKGKKNQVMYPPRGCHSGGHNAAGRWRLHTTQMNTVNPGHSRRKPASGYCWMARAPCCCWKGSKDGTTVGSAATCAGLPPAPPLPIPSGVWGGMRPALTLWLARRLRQGGEVGSDVSWRHAMPVVGSLVLRGASSMQCRKPLPPPVILCRATPLTWRKCGGGGTEGGSERANTPSRT